MGGREFYKYCVSRGRGRCGKMQGWGVAGCEIWAPAAKVSKVLNFGSCGGKFWVISGILSVFLRRFSDTPEWFSVTCGLLHAPPVVKTSCAEHRHFSKEVLPVVVTQGLTLGALPEHVPPQEARATRWC